MLHIKFLEIPFTDGEISAITEIVKSQQNSSTFFDHTH